MAILLKIIFHRLVELFCANYYYKKRYCHGYISVENTISLLSGVSAIIIKTDMKSRETLHTTNWEIINWDKAQTQSTVSLQSEQGFPHSSVGKESTCNEGDPSLIPGWGRSAGEGFGCPLHYSWASLVAQLVKNLPAIWETCFDPWVGKIPWRRERLPIPVFWPGEFHGLYSPWGCKELDMTMWLSLSLSSQNRWVSELSSSAEFGKFLRRKLTVSSFVGLLESRGWRTCVNQVLNVEGNSLVIQCLGLPTSTVVSSGSIPDQGAKIPHAKWLS